MKAVRRRKIQTVVGLIFCLLFGLPAILALKFHIELVQLSELQWYFALAAGVGGTLFSLWSLRCPRCNSYLGTIKAKVCPRCGMSLTETAFHSAQSLGTIDTTSVKTAFSSALDKISGLKTSQKKTKSVLRLVAFAAFFCIAYLASAQSRQPQGASDYFLLVIALALMSEFTAQKISFYYFKICTLKHWRCPACKEDLPQPPGCGVKICPECGVELR